MLRAAAGEEPATPKAVVSFKPIPSLEWPTDKETFRDVFAFDGPAPERVNGRIAMVSFVGIALTELSTHDTVLEQLSANWGSALFLSVLLALGTIMPKFISGMPLRELNNAATKESLAGEGAQAYLAYFDQWTEKIVGRTAMLGITGMTIVEVFKGSSIF